MTLQAGPSAGQLDLRLHQGATWHVQFTYKVGADPATATPVDLTHYVARLQVRSAWYSETPLLALTEAAGITLGGGAGTIDLNLSATETAALTWREGVYDLELVTPEGGVRRVLAGKVTVIPEVTR